MVKQDVPLFLSARGFSPDVITGLWIVYAKHYLTGFLLNFTYGSYVGLMRELMKKMKRSERRLNSSRRAGGSRHGTNSSTGDVAGDAAGDGAGDDKSASCSHSTTEKADRTISHSNGLNDTDSNAVTCCTCGKTSSAIQVGGELEIFMNFLLKYFPSLNRLARKHETIYETVRAFWRVLSKIIADSNNTGLFLGYWTILYHVFLRVLHRSRQSPTSPFSVSTPAMAFASFLSGFIVQFIFKGVSWKIAMYCLLRSLMGLTRMQRSAISSGVESAVKQSETLPEASTSSVESAVADGQVDNTEVIPAQGAEITSAVESASDNPLVSSSASNLPIAAASQSSIVPLLLGGLGGLTLLRGFMNKSPSVSHSPKSTVARAIGALANHSTLSYVLVNVGIGWNLYYYPDYMDVAYQNFLGSMACIYRYTTKDIIDINMVDTRPCYPYHPPIKNCFQSLKQRTPTIFLKVFKIYASVHLFALLLGGKLWKRPSGVPLLQYYQKIGKNLFTGVLRSCLFLGTQLVICGPSPCIHNYLANKFNNGKHSRFLMVLPWIVGSFSIAFEASSRRSELALYSLWRLFICYVNRIRNVKSDTEHDPMFDRLFSALMFGLATCFWIVVKNRDSSYLKRLDRMILAHVFPPHLEMKI